MVIPHEGDRIVTPRGAGTITRVFYHIVTSLFPSRRRFILCTVLLDQSYIVKFGQYSHEVKTIEAEVRYQRSRTYTSE